VDLVYLVYLVTDRMGNLLLLFLLFFRLLLKND